MILKKSQALGFKIGHFNQRTTIYKYDIPEQSSKHTSKFSMKSPNTGYMTFKANLCRTEGYKWGQLLKTKRISERAFLGRRVRLQGLNQGFTAFLQKKPRGDRQGSLPADQGEKVQGEVCLHPRSLSRIIRAMPKTEQARGCLDTDCQTEPVPDKQMQP